MRNSFTHDTDLLSAQKEHASVDEHENPAQVYGMMMIIHASLCLAVWITSMILFSTGNLAAHKMSIDILWITFALSVPMHAFIILRYPDLFKISSREVSIEKPSPASQREHVESLKTALSLLMTEEKPFLNAGLTLQDLAEMLHVNIHTLSRVINDGYGKNFFDFINEYRIEEFKRLVHIDAHRHGTFLAIAMESGFNSKTTFNRSFKKSTGKTPREFFSVAKEFQLEEIG